MYDKICPVCGMRLSQFYKIGTLGCPDCYRACKQEAGLAIRKIQHATTHKGKMPKLSSSDKELLATYRALLAEKEQAGIDGRFTRMAELSSQIAELVAVLKERGLM